MLYKKRLKTRDKKNVRKEWVKRLVVDEIMKILTDELIEFIGANVYVINEKDRLNQGIIDELTVRN